jgi:hypothetical protein
MNTLITSGPDYKINEDDLDALSLAVIELGVTSVITLGFSPGLNKWAASRRIKITTVRSAAEAIRISQAAVILPGKFMDGLVQSCKRSNMKVWDWRGTSAADKATIMADEEAAAHYDAIVNGDIDPIGYNADMRGMMQGQKAAANG